MPPTSIQKVQGKKKKNKGKQIIKHEIKCRPLMKGIVKLLILFL